MEEDHSQENDNEDTYRYNPEIWQDTRSKTGDAPRAGKKLYTSV